MIWQAGSYNQRGQLTAYSLGDNLDVTRVWDSYGFPREIVVDQVNPAENLTDQEYDFDPKTANLTARKEWKYYRFEHFRYDDLNRLVADSLGSADYRNTSYTANGNITSRSDIGDYVYSQTHAGPHAVTGIENSTGGHLPAFSQSTGYTAFNKAAYISQGDYTCYITYGPDRLRRKTVLNHTPGDNTVLTKYYAFASPQGGFGDYEKEIDANGTRELHYISGGDGLAAIYVKYDTGADSLFYIMQDHLGSLVGDINSESGHFYRQSFDASSVTCGFGFASSPNPSV